MRSDHLHDDHGDDDDPDGDHDDDDDHGLDDIPASAAVVDRHGVIVAVNTAWVEFGTVNGAVEPLDAVGRSYTDWLQDPDATARGAAAGVFDVIEGRAAEFTLTYPCHSPSVDRWLRFLVVPLRTEAPPRSVLTIHVRADPAADRQLRAMARSLTEPPAGVVTLCAWCADRHREGEGEWQRGLPVPVPTLVSHGICDDCVGALDLPA